jgi:hypothetical protein
LGEIARFPKRTDIFVETDIRAIGDRFHNISTRSQNCDYRSPIVVRAMTIVDSDGMPHYTFPDYDSTIFLEEMPHDSDSGDLSDDEYDARVLKLLECSEDYARRANYRLPLELSLPLKVDLSRLQPSVHFAFRRHGRLSTKLRFLTRSYFRNANDLTVQLLQSMKEKRQNHIPLKCDADRLHLYFSKTYLQMQIRRKLLLKIVSLKFYLDKFLDSPRFPEIPVEHLKQAMLESSEKVIEAIEFPPHGFFDDFLSFFVGAHPTLNLNLFDEIGDRIAQKIDDVVDFSPLTDIMTSLAQLLRPKQQKEVIVIKNGVYRIFFDRFYLICPRFIAGAANEPSLENVCERLRLLTPRVLSVPEKMMPPEMMDVPFATLVAQNPLLKAAVEELDILVFLTNPIDIMSHIFLALKKLEEFASLSAADLETDGLAFDDFFPLFCLVLAMAWPGNARAIAHGLAKSTGLLISSSLDFAKLFFTSTIEYIAKVNLEDFEPKTILA